MTSLLLLGTALAATGHHHTPAETLTKQALYDSVIAHFDPAIASPSLTDRFACGTGAVQQLKDHWDWFDPAERAELTDLVAPWKQDLLEELPGTPAPPPGAGPSDTCFGQFAKNRHNTEHFGIEWDDSNIDWDDIEDFGEALEESWQVQVEERGWEAPYKTDQYKLLVYVDGSNYAGAYTTVDNCNGVYVAYIVTGNGIFWGDWYQDLAAHEFNHASQFAYGYGHEFYFWEATATYIEEQSFPDHDAWAPYIAGYTDNPWIALNASSQSSTEIFSHMYAMAILNFHLDEYWGGEDMSRQLWEYAKDFPRTVYELYLPDVLEDLGYDWDEIYTGFMAANSVMDYREGHLMGRIDKLDWVDVLPLTGFSERDTKPENLGQNYWRIDGNAYESDEPDLYLHFEGGLGAEWKVLLVGTSGDTVQRIVEAEVVDGEENEETLEAFMPDWGEHADVWVVMSPTVQGYDDAYSYAFDLWAEPAPEPEIEEEVPVESDDGEAAIFGSCSTTPAGTASGWLAVLGLAGLLVRRPR